MCGYKSTVENIITKYCSTSLPLRSCFTRGQKASHLKSLVEVKQVICCAMSHVWMIKTSKVDDDVTQDTYSYIHALNYTTDLL